MSYLGMQWFKCDLQMQTPGDHYNWSRNCDARVRGDSTKEELLQSVDSYLRRCHEVELDIIGVTDHNFIGREYLELLIDRNKRISEEVGRNPLTIFPGFEIEVSQGLGVHLLCLFDPSTPLDYIDELVSSFGLFKHSRVENGNILPATANYEKILLDVQENNDFPGIVIAAHPQSESGMLHDRFLTEHFQRKMFTDPRLLAVEIPKPIRTLSNGIQKILLSSPDCNREWKRESPIATVMSSDAYSLYEGDKGYIGKRHTWIQMSIKTISALLQSFIDNNSRISHEFEKPTPRHGKIKKIKISNAAFLEDQIIHFSPNFNCIIGGRGSGKSSILEYIRLCTKEDLDSEQNEQIKRLKRTLTEESEVKITWEYDNGLIDEFKYDVSENKPNIVSRDGEVTDLSTILNSLGIQIYSQREITYMAQVTPSLMPLIDRITGEELKRLVERETVLREEIRILQQKETVLKRLESERKELVQECVELSRQWKAFVVVQEEKDKKINAEKIKKYLHSIKPSTDEIIKLFDDLKSKIQDNTPVLESPLKSFVEEDYFSHLEVGLEKAAVELSAEIDKALLNFDHKVMELTVRHQAWDEVNRKLNGFEYEFINACKEQQIKPEDLERLISVEEQISIKQESIQEKDINISAINEELRCLPTKINELYQLWNNQTDLRKGAISELLSNEAIPKISGAQNQSFIQVDINPMGDANHFNSIWGEIPHDGRSRMGRNWEDIGVVLYENYMISDYKNPWELFSIWLNERDEMPTDLQEFHENLKIHFYENYVEMYNELKLTRVDDLIDIILFRNDGSRAGSLVDNGLSDGQKNTAILTLLFSEGKSPIVIDQPEDELDSDFIYNELVPIIRKMKINRQIIVATHNANLPVNGDSELIYALSTDLGKGKTRTNGGIDNPNVRQAILDIMEGSEEAFRRRKEKYYT
ncbi:TrlF family AAA-like ATPase [Anaerobacillus sp. 1_MG-2023]|uniref:TrlF family AAA-like ATPase n=1 Tax=Anaerobacillus sp. 1_MG-2023 TaxID=3062655 RepID=UPI0026E35067|nr:AAA family ATPase [Anaerobacillus sp. 1_MG-2023]MDO6655000.1 AAA family ATPase [Anaerobacillus sp. 1_MG-2023]